MSKYRVYGIVVGSKFIGEFEADTENAAIEMAEASDNMWVSLCHQCADEVDSAEITSVQAELVTD